MKKQTDSKLKQRWQALRSRLQQTRSHTQDRYQKWHRRQKEYDNYAPDAGNNTRSTERVTMTSVVRILLAELGEKEYWQTIWHLIWRPGYAIADYLNGKYRHFLRPFQLLIATTLLLALALFIVPAETNVQNEETFSQRLEQKIEEIPDAEKATEVLDYSRKTASFIDKYHQWNEEHLEFGLLSRSILVILFTWLLFRKSPRKEYPSFNFAEILTAQIFILAQLQILNVVWVLVTGWFVPTIDFRPYAYPYILANIIVFIDYQQLFGRKWYDTLWRTLFCMFWFV
jgi:hypothetical protein